MYIYMSNYIFFTLIISRNEPSTSSNNSITSPLQEINCPICMDSKKQVSCTSNFSSVSLSQNQTVKFKLGLRQWFYDRFQGSLRFSLTTWFVFFLKQHLHCDINDMCLIYFNQREVAFLNPCNTKWYLYLAANLGVCLKREGSHQKNVYIFFIDRSRKVADSWCLQCVVMYFASLV